MFSDSTKMQACRKHIYSGDDSQDESREENTGKVTAMPDDLGKACEFLIHLMSSNPSAHKGNKRLLEEIEMFSRSLTRE